MASLDPEITKTHKDREKVKEEETGPQQKQRNQRSQAQDDKKKAKTKLMNLLIKNKTTVWDEDLWYETPTPRRLADSNATTAVGKRQRSEITVKSKDIDGGTTKSKSDVGSEPFKTDGLEYDEQSRPIREYYILERLRMQTFDPRRTGGGVVDGGTKNEWFKMLTFDPRGNGGGVVDGGSSGGGGSGGVSDSGGTGGVTGGQQG